MAIFLDYLVLFLGNIAYVYMVDNFFSNFFEVKESVKNKYIRSLLALIFVIARLGLNSFQSGYINLLGIQLLMLFYIMLIFSGSIGRRLVSFVMAIALILGGELLFAVIIGVPYYMAGQTRDIGMSSLVIPYFILILMTYLLFIIVGQFSSKARENMPSRIFSMYLCLPISSLGILVLTYHSGINVIENVAVRIMLIVCTTLMFLGNILISFAFQQHVKESYEKNEIELLMMKREMEWKHQMKLVEQNEERHKFIHDIANLLKVIRGLIDEKDDGEVIKIISELSIDIEKNERIIYCQNPILNILLSEKVAEAEKSNVDMNVFIETNVHLGKIGEIDLITSLGNLLDNAIRGASECNEKKEVNVKIFIEKGMLVTKINNRFSGKLIRKEGRFLTTKKDKNNHGFGIKSVENVANKYNGRLICTENGKEFQALLYLSLK